MQEPHLAIIPSVPIWNESNSLVFDRKFYDGILLYLKLWPGAITCVMSKTNASLPAFGVVSKKPEELPFKVVVLNEGEKVASNVLTSVSVVLASGDSFNYFHLSGLCKKMNIKCVYIIEYTPETRYQIARLSTKNPLLKLRRLLYIWNQERKRVAAFDLCDGLQINGTAAYAEYNHVKNNMLYFDTRVYKKNIITSVELERRLTSLLERKPLRLAFSGRLIPMKGADHLIELAVKLRKRKTIFQLTIYGVGDLDEEMRSRIKKHRLENVVSMPGSVDFYNELLPNLKNNTDLFVCLHRQGDPSCTYLETLSCGVPIVGYNNSAFAGLLVQADMGWGAKLNDLEEVATIIAALDKNRASIAEKANNSVAFARRHNFETTFKNRIDHLISLSAQPARKLVCGSVAL